MNKQKKGFLSRLFTSDFDYSFIGHRKFWFSFSAVLLLICILSMAFRGLNLGIEFEGGSVFRTSVSSVTETTVDDFQKAVNDTGLRDLKTQVNTLSDTEIRVQTRSLETDEIPKVRQAIADKAGVSSEQVTYSLIGPSWGKQITTNALVALGIFVVLVFGLIWIYFRDWKSSLASIISLVHDLIITVGVFSILGFNVTPSTFIGVLTILGYSLYDTVIVFDKIKENTKDFTKQNKHTFAYLTNLAINQVLVRSINTTIIVLLPIVALLITGVFVLHGEGPLAELGLSLFVGIISGAYSSLFIAAPLYSWMREQEPEVKKHTQMVEAGAPEKSRPQVKAEIVDDQSTESDEDALVGAGSGGAGYALSEDEAKQAIAHGRNQRTKQPRAKRTKK